jgi:hypothetical protein
MGKHNQGRRAFLKGAALGAGAVAGVGIIPQTRAETHAQHTSQSARRTRMAEDRAFFNQDDAATISAFTERLMPGEPGKPGARDADVLNYIDLALDAHCGETYKKPFAQLDAAQQDVVIMALERGQGDMIHLALRPSVLQHRAHAHNGRNVRRSDLRRQ